MTNPDAGNMRTCEKTCDAAEDNVGVFNLHLNIHTKAPGRGCSLRFLFHFNNKTLNVPHDTTFCMENNAKTLIIHDYKFVIT